MKLGSNTFGVPSLGDSKNLFGAPSGGFGGKDSLNNTSKAFGGTNLQALATSQKSNEQQPAFGSAFGGSGSAPTTFGAAI